MIDQLLRTPLTDLVGVRHPVVQTGMGWVAGPRLVVGTANAGGLGILASATMTFEELEKAILEARRERFAGGGDTMVPHFSLDTGNEISAWPFPEGYEVFHTFQQTVAPNYDFDATLESVDLLMTYDIRPYLHRIVDTPTLMIVAENDDITLWDEAIGAYNAIPTAKKKLVVIDKSDHLALYSDQSLLMRAAGAATDWFVEQLAPRGQ